MTRVRASAASAPRRLFRNDVLKGSPANDRKERVVENEEPHVPSRVVGDAGTDAADDDRDGEREEDQREQGVLDGLVLAPSDRSAIWLGKALSVLAFLVSTHDPGRIERFATSKLALA